MGTFSTSTGERISKANIDANIRVAKGEFVSENIDMHFCWACGSTNERITISHIVSVNKCQNDGMSEYAWNKDNFQLECIQCHVQTEIRRFKHHDNYIYKANFIDKYEARETLK